MTELGWAACSSDVMLAVSYVGVISPSTATTVSSFSVI